MRTRVLPREEWDRLDAETRTALDTMRPEDVRVVVVEREGRIVARMAVLRIPHWECFWMAPEAVGNAGITRALLTAAREQVEEWSPHWFYANADNDAMQATLSRLGGEWMPFHTYMLPVRRLEMEEACQQQSGCLPPPGC